MGDLERKLCLACTRHWNRTFKPSRSYRNSILWRKTQGWNLPPQELPSLLRDAGGEMLIVNSAQMMGARQPVLVIKESNPEKPANGAFVGTSQFD